MKKQILILFSLLFSLSAFAQNNNFPFVQHWEKVENYANRWQPQSALQEVEIIFTEAQRTNNFPQTVRAFVARMRFTLDVNPDEAQTLLRDFEAFAENFTQAAQQALLHSMIAEMYAMFYNNQRWTINQRTAIEGFIPENITEWTRNIFFDKIVEELKLSLAERNMLQRTSVAPFEPLITRGEHGALYQPTLFDFLGQRAVTILQGLGDISLVRNPLQNSAHFAPAREFVNFTLEKEFAHSRENLIIEIYQQLISFRLQDRRNTLALIFIDLQRLDFVRSNTQNLDADELFENALLALKNQHINHEAVVEVMSRLANFYLQKSHGNDDEADYFRRKAYDIAKDGINRFPNYKRINLLRQTVAQITQKSININFPAVAKPNTEMKITVTSRNISELRLRIHRVNATAQDYHLFTRNNFDNRPHPDRRLIETQNLTIAPNENFGTDTTEFIVRVPEYGIYEFTVMERGSRERREQAHGVFVSSDFMFLMRADEPEIVEGSSRSSAEILVLDRVSGNVIENVEIVGLNTEWGRSQIRFQTQSRTHATTNRDGFAIAQGLPFQSYTYFLSKGDDRYFSSDAFHRTFRQTLPNNNVEISLFTDRSLYRPGQTVYFKGIAFRRQSQTVIENETFEVRLFDANGQEIEKIDVHTNDFGSFSGEFVLPQSGLNGAFRLEAHTNVGHFSFSTTFFVEEYRRPTFEVLITRPENEVFFGEEVNFSGTVRAYAGHTLPNAQVRYTVTRRVHHFWRWFMPMVSNQTVASGTTVSDARGQFTVSFTPERVRLRTFRGEPQIFTYELEVSATDTRGETQQGRQHISIGDRSLFIISNVPAQHKSDNLMRLRVSTETLNGQNIDSQINYAVYRLENPNDFRENIRNLSVLATAQQVLSGVFDTSAETLELDLRSAESGFYRIIFTTQDSRNQEVKTESNFILFCGCDTQPPVKSYFWLIAQKTDVVVGENAEILFGTSVSDASVLYEIMRGDTLIKREWLSFDNELQTFEIPFKAEYGDGINVIFTMVRDERIFSQNTTIRRRLEEKRLTPTLSVFRDKLQPGETAEWTITIPEAREQTAELLVSMYDASLDAIRPHAWNFNPAYRLFIPTLRNWSARGFGNQGASGWFSQGRIEIPNINLNEINWTGLDSRGNFAGMLQGRVAGLAVTGASGRQSLRASAPAMEMSADMVVAEDSEVVFMLAENVEMEMADATPEVSAERQMYGGGEVSEQQPQVQIRTNFNETAFFYPQLRTDQDGNVKISFTVPESLTRWNVQMLAHTPDLFFGQSTAQVVTQKDLMVQLNLPRFVRQSDKLVLFANVINLTDSVLEANVRFELINPETEKPLAIKDNQARKITLNAGETQAVSWEISEFSGHELLIAKVVAQAGNFSDGEQHFLPILPDKILITETLPLVVRGNERHDFVFESLKNQAREVENKRLTIEFTTNPIWYAVQALPTLSAPENENAIDFFTAFYVNGLATHIANSTPRIAEIFDRWQNEGGTRDALLSNLERNTELKNMLLEETPWVFAAQNESEQKRQIALLFDLNMQKNQGEQFLERLQELQLPSGGFAWFSGMRESRQITQQILLGMARFNKIVNPDAPTSDWERRAIQFIDREIVRDFENIRRWTRDCENNMCIGNIQWFYLHVRSKYLGVPMNSATRQAVDFFTRQAEKYWTEATLYGKAATALIAARRGNTTLANQILNAFRENALQTDEMGMFWARNTASFFWSERPVFVHTAIIEAFAEIDKNTPEIDEMKIWLLRQKQTQRWDTPISTVDAIYALLHFGSDWLSDEKTVEIKLNNQILATENREAGTGYFKETISGENITSEMSRISVQVTPKSGESQGRGISWGAMFWQYKQDVSKVQQSSSALSLTKQLFVERVVGTQTTMIPIEQAELRVGDKIITRLTVTTDRDLEFVALRDLRAACLEPVNQRSHTVWREGIVYYETIKDSSTQFFFNFLPRGTYVFEHETWINNAGVFSNAPASIQCLYAPEFVSFSSGGKIVVK